MDHIHFYLKENLKAWLHISFFPQNKLAHVSHFFQKISFQTCSLMPYFLKNLEALGSQVFKRKSSNMITHTFISPKCFNMWIIYFFQNKIFKHAHPHLLFSKTYMHMDHIFAKENNQTCWLTLLFLQNVLAHVSHSFHKQ